MDPEVLGGSCMNDPVFRQEVYVCWCIIFPLRRLMMFAEGTVVCCLCCAKEFGIAEGIPNAVCPNRAHVDVYECHPVGIQGGGEISPGENFVGKISPLRKVAKFSPGEILA